MNGWSTLVRQASALCFLLAVALAVVMLAVAHQVQSLEEDLGSLRKGIAAEKQTMHVLQAELSYLAEPERLRRLATAHLGLTPVEPDQLGSFETLEAALHHRRDGMVVRAPSPGVHAVAATAAKERRR